MGKRRFESSPERIEMSLGDICQCPPSECCLCEFVERYENKILEDIWGSI